MVSLLIEAQYLQKMFVIAAGHVGASAEFSDNYVSWIVVFDAFLFLGLALVVAVLITGWLSKDLKRHPTWYSFMVSWVLYAICRLYNCAFREYG